jgi:hypothetical protein
MNLRRAVQCGALTCLLTLAVPSVARAHDDRGGGSQTTHCFNQSERASTATEPSGNSNNLLAQQETDRGHDSRDTRHGFGHNSTWWYWFWYWYWRHRDHCVPDPPADVPEAPQVLMLSGSAVLTGGAAMLMIRRRSKNSAPARA